MFENIREVAFMNLKIIFFALTLAFPAHPAFAGLSKQERDVVQKCLANVDPGKGWLSPVTAVECVKALNEGDPEPLIKKYAAEDPETAGRLLGYNNAIIDLKEIVVTLNDRSLSTALNRVWRNGRFSSTAFGVALHPDCTLCEMRLGPKPEDIFEWVGKYAPGRRRIVERVFLSWDSLGPVHTKSFSSSKYGKTRDSWSSHILQERYSFIGMWASIECDSLAASAGAALAADPGARQWIAELSAILREDMKLVGLVDFSCTDKVDSLLAKAGGKDFAPQKKAPSAADKKAGELAVAGRNINALGGKSVADQNNYLGRTFDNSASGTGAVPGKPPAAGSAAKPAADKPAIKPVPLTSEQGAELSTQMIRMEGGKVKGYLADVMRQTAAGKRAIAFYEDPNTPSNKLDVGFIHAEGILGVWNTEKKTLRLWSGMAEEFAAKRGMTMPQLMRDKAAMKDLALYLSPVMVHESEHQNQTAREAAAGVNYKKSSGEIIYTRANENLSNTESAKHIIEYCSKNGGSACYGELHPMHIQEVEKFMEGGLAALDTMKAPLYSRIDSFEGGAASEFRAAQLYALQLNTLETLQRTNPSLMTEKRKQDREKLHEIMNTRFKWYTIAYLENQEAERNALAFRKKYAGGLGSTVPGL